MHEVELSFEASSEIARNDSTQAMTWGRLALDGMEVLRTGTREQNVLGHRGDALRIDWGYLHMLAPGGEPQLAIADRHCIMQKGRVVWHGGTAQLAGDDALKARYLGV